ncbi:MAG: isoprenylcysteine carboxylmethyltransferase family protein [Oligoflexales bacterium]|nr:isoprenylcysteine carboxylmethyltransferase family protein [Oligoflexales bacterium]
MRRSSWLAIITFILIGGIAIPWGVINLNNSLELPRLVHPALQVLGALLILAGLGVTGYCKRVFRIVGKGTPVPIEPPKEFVVVGLYKYSRNPMYVSYIVIWFGVFLLFGHILLLGHCLVWWLLWQLWIVFIEEPGLRKRFGLPYEEYPQQVPRWIGKVKDRTY